MSRPTPAEREAAAATFRALNDNRPLTIEEALDFGLLGSNLRCNRCGSFGAEWIPNQRPGWGSLALCPPHRDELKTELRRHEQALRELRTVAFEQPPAVEVERVRKAYRRAR